MPGAVFNGVRGVARFPFSWTFSILLVVKGEGWNKLEV